MPTPQPPIIFLAFARSDNPRGDLLPRLPEEARQLRSVLSAAERAGGIELQVRQDSTLDDILAVFDDDRCRGRIAIFHFAGHADGQSLLVEQLIGAAGLRAAITGQAGLALVFLNACSTQAQADGLHRAGARAVLATSMEVRDDWALAFAVRFYRALAGGASIQEAFTKAHLAAEGDAYAEYGTLDAKLWLLSTPEMAAGQWRLPPAPAIANRPSMPLQKPLRAQHFTGRSADLAALLADLQPGNVVSLCAGGGMGKSALAAEVVWKLAPGDEPPSLFPDGILDHRFYSEPQAVQALEALARAFGVDPQPDTAAAARAAVRGKRLLLVLDGAEACDDLAAVLALREVAPQCGVLITSRRHHPGVTHKHDVNPLPPDAGVTLLRSWAGSYAAADAEAIQLVEQLGRLPLALLLAGSYMANRRQYAREYAAWLKEEGLVALDFGQHQQESIPHLMRRSLAAVSEHARLAYAVAGVLAFAPFEQRTVAATLGMTPAAAGRLLGELVDYGLLLRPDEHHQVTHALAHAYARMQMTVPLEALARLAKHYITFAEQQTARGVLGYVELDQQLGHILAVQASCLRDRQWDEVRQLAWKTDSYLDLRGRWSERLAVLDNALTAAKQAGDRYDEGAIANLLGLAYADLGEVRRAVEYHEQVLAIAREIGDRRGEGQALGNLGIAYRNLGEVRRAVEYYEQQLVIARQTGDRRGEGQALNNLGIVYRNLGEVRRAIEYYEQRLAIAREIGDRRGEGQTLGNLGSAYFSLGEMRRAIEYHEQALAIAREIGDRRGGANALNNLGNAYTDLGEVHRAIEYHEQALAIDREIGDPRGEGRALNNLGLAYYSLGEVRRAIEYHEQALTILSEIGDLYGETAVLDSLGSDYSALSELRRAIDYFEQGLAIARKIGDRRAEAIIGRNLGLVYEQEGDLQRAIDSMQVCIAYEREIGHVDAAAHSDYVQVLRARLSGAK